jgi:SNF2 family DNA or RNA helicase
MMQVLTLYGVRHEHIDGRMTFQQRASVVKKFCANPDIRVLIMSSVGSVGLNLTVASVIIFLVRFLLSHSALNSYVL